MKSDGPKSGSSLKEKSKVQEEEHPDQGAAYGKNKGELSGREFGQWRSEEARAKVKTKGEEVEEVVAEAEEEVAEEAEEGI